MAIKSVRLNVLTNAPKAKAELDDITATADKLGMKVVTVKANLGGTAGGQIDYITRKITRLSGETVVIKVRSDQTGADAKLDEMELKLHRLDRTEAIVKVKADTTDLAKGAAGLAGFDKWTTIASSDASMFTRVMTGLGLATGIAEPLITGAAVAAMSLGSSLLAGGLGAGAFGLALLGPIETNKKFKASLTGVETTVEKWGNGLSKFTLKPIYMALALVNPLLRDMTPFVKAAAGAFDILVGQLAKGVTGGGFTGWLSKELPLVKPSIVELGDAIGHLVVGIGGIFQAFNPEAGGMMKGLDDITAKFAKWGSTLSSHSGFQSLMEQFHQVTPVAVHDISMIVEIVARLVGSMSGLSTFSNSRSLFSLASPFLNLLNTLLKLHPQVVDAALYMLAFADAIKKVGMAAGGITTGIENIGKLGTTASSTATGIKQMSKGVSDSEYAASEASGAWGTFGGKLGNVKTGLTNMKSGLKDSEVAASDASGVMGTFGGKIALLGGGIASFATGIFKASTYTKIWTGIQAAFNFVMDLNPVVLITVAIIALIGVIVLVTMHSKLMREFFLAAFHDIEDAAKDVWTWVKSNWPLLLGILTGPIGIAAIEIYKHTTDIHNWFFDLYHDVVNVWGQMWSDLKNIASGAVNVTGNIVRGLENAFMIPVRFVVDDVWDKLAGIWNSIAGAVGLGSLKLPVAHMASGGKVNQGIGPTADDVPIFVSRGETVVSADTSRALAPIFSAAGVPGYASGGVPSAPAGRLGGLTGGAQLAGVGGVTSSIVNSLKSAYNWTVGKIEGVAFGGVETLLDKIGGGSLGKILGGLIMDTIKSLAGKLKIGANNTVSDGRTQYNIAAGVTQWEGDVSKVLSMLGLPQSLLSRVMYQMQTESGGNPNAINNSDINAQEGDPSRGLLQTIMSTFQAYRSPSLPDDIYNPMANIFAAVNYARNVYGPTLMRGGVGMGSGHGYALGGPILEPIMGMGMNSGMTYSFGESGPEWVTPGMARPVGGGGGDVYNIYPPVSATDPEAYARVMIQELRTYKRHHGNQATGIG